MNQNQNRVKIKTCGLKRIEDIETVNKYNPAYVGFVFAKSKRKIDFKQAKILKNRLSENILAVGVFLDPDIKDILYLLNNNIINMVQLHGNENKEFINKLKDFDKRIEIIKSIEIKDNEDKNDIDDKINYWEDSIVDYLLLDSGKRQW